ncbi:Protein ALP1-like [Holothuria leucospilota]|uniref:Protein ALP1-like n=1 Tax=Holothuria leucospilota TaxID=206669 RepID=A0A9Q1BXG9_HOLLE|nr:Protein ALP1-like [Holothuria leucospilota]
MPVPDADLWKSVANQFETRSNFQNCIGALDGKHVVIQAPPNSGSMFFNYKGTFSIVLLALVDADYKFIAIDVGAYGRNSDGGIYASSSLGQMLETDTLDVPGPKVLPGAPHLGTVPHVIVADEAFPLKTYIMRPCPGRHLGEERKFFNYRLSRARRIVENAFGILRTKWQIYQRKIQQCNQSCEGNLCSA